MSVRAIAAMLALSSLSTATAAFARGGGMGHVGGIRHRGGVSHWSGMGWHGPVGHLHPSFGHRRFFAFGFGPYFGYPSYADYGYDDCWQWRHVPTRWGWRWRTVNVCYGSY